MQDRIPDELRVVNAFMANMSCFANVPPYVQKEIVAVATYERVEKGTRIISEGDIGDAFYMILEGTVIVMKGTNTLLSTEEAGGAFGERALMMSAEEAEAAGSAADSPEMQALSPSGVGKRSASCIARTVVEILSLTADMYRAILRSTHITDMRKKVSFLCTLPMFSDGEAWSENELVSLSTYFR
jgi:cAMP-dependent protein kinase regulator